MAAAHLEILVEEQSMEAFLEVLLPRMLPVGTTCKIHLFEGKFDLLRKLEGRLRAYASWIPEDWRLVVMVDRDNDDCKALKARLEDSALAAGLVTRSMAGGGAWRLVNRIVVEELEAWYFGDWEAVCAAYPRVKPNAVSKAAYRDPDAVAGGTWEALERILKGRGYFANGLRKIEAARGVAAHFDPTRSRSRSFEVFRDAIAEAVA